MDKRIFNLFRLVMDKRILNLFR